MTADSPFALPEGAKSKGAGRSMFGQQADSRKATLPTYSFSHISNRDQASKMFLSKAHINADHKGLAFTGEGYEYSSVDKQVASNKITAPSANFSHAPKLTLKPNEVPGPGMYSARSSLGDQPSSPHVSQPNFSFGNTTREDSAKVFLSPAHQGERKGMQGPPPGTYENLPGATGQQALSSKRNSPGFAMAKADRLRDKYDLLAQTLPSVGQYEAWTSMGKQPLSQFKTLPAYKFQASSNWEAEGKRFLTAGHTEALKGTLSPGNFDTQTDANMTSFGKQSLSHKPSVAGSKFSASERFTPFKTKETPGPGFYD